MAQDAAIPSLAAEEKHKPETNRLPTSESIAPRSRQSSRANGIGIQAEETRICVVMVGLPARGKSLIASKGKSRRRITVAETHVDSLFQSFDIWHGSPYQQRPSTWANTVAQIHLHQLRNSSIQPMPKEKD